MGDGFDQLQEVFRALAERADEPGMARTFRRLGTTRNQFKVTERDPVTRELQFVFRFDRDAEIFAEYQFSGKKTSGSGTLAKQRNSVYEGTVGGLKEDVEFIVRAADFDTAPRRIRIIPPPSLKRLIRDQAEPGYLHHAPPLNEGYNALEGQLQKVAAKDLSLTGDRSVVVVPSGTVLTLTGEAYTADDGSIPESDRIVKAEATPVSGRFPGTVYDDKAKPTQAPVPLAITGDGAAFSVTFNETVPLPRRVAGGTDFAGNAFAAAVGALRRYTDFRLTENVEFKVEFTNKYNVKTTRTFVIQVVQDQAPVVEFAVDVIRKSGNFYLVTPKARIPFEANSFVKDDRGLSKLVYTFSYYSEDSDFVRGLRTKFALRSLLDVPMPGSLAGALPLRHADNFRLLDKSDDRQYPSASVSEFDNQQGTLLRDNRDDLAALLATPRGEELTPQLLKLLDEKYPGRAPGSKAFWVGGPQAVRAFWVGEPYTAKAVWVADAADPQSFNKIDLASTERGAFPPGADRPEGHRRGGRVPLVRRSPDGQAGRAEEPRPRLLRPEGAARPGGAEDRGQGHRRADHLPHGPERRGDRQQRGQRGRSAGDPERGGDPPADRLRGRPAHRDRPGGEAARRAAGRGAAQARRGQAEVRVRALQQRVQG